MNNEEIPDNLNHLKHRFAIMVLSEYAASAHPQDIFWSLANKFKIWSGEYNLYDFSVDPKVFGQFIEGEPTVVTIPNATQLLSYIGDEKKLLNTTYHFDNFSLVFGLEFTELAEADELVCGNDFDTLIIIKDNFSKKHDFKFITLGGDKSVAAEFAALLGIDSLLEIWSSALTGPQGPFYTDTDLFNL